jgi:thioredoxin-like negative regulator of GroEL
MHQIDSPADVGVIKAASKTLLLFTAPGCPESKLMVDRLERVGARNSSLLVATADTTRVPGLAKVLGVTQVPTVVLFRRGQHVTEITGRASWQQMQDLADSVLW